MATRAARARGRADARARCATSSLAEAARAALPGRPAARARAARGAATARATTSWTSCRHAPRAARPARVPRPRAHPRACCARSRRRSGWSTCWASMLDAGGPQVVFGGELAEPALAHLARRRRALGPRPGRGRLGGRDRPQPHGLRARDPAGGLRLAAAHARCGTRESQGRRRTRPRKAGSRCPRRPRAGRSPRAPSSRRRCARPRPRSRRARPAARPARGQPEHEALEREVARRSKRGEGQPRGPPTSGSRPTSTTTASARSARSRRRSATATRTRQGPAAGGR